jgi:cellulose biosynthesis protein BcsQ
MKVVAVYNVKGGVGKTAIALNLADAAVRARHRTLLWDLDEQGAASAILGHAISGKRQRARRTYRIDDHVEPSGWPGLDLIPADARVHLLDRHDRAPHLRELLMKMAAAYDRVIVDCPPTLGLVTEQICELADLIVVPVVPSALSEAAYRQLTEYVQARDGGEPELLRVWSMVDRRRRAHRELAESDSKVVAIPYAVAMEQMATTGEPVAKGAPRSPAAAQIKALWKKIEARLAAGALAKAA